VRLIDAEGRQLGVLDTRRALEIATEQGYDLVEVSPNTDPPVCRLMDYGKYKYQQSKKQHKKKSQHTAHTKEIKFRPFTGDHDFEVKLRHILEFLSKGNKVKITVVFRGRELQFREHGDRIIQKITEGITEHGIIESDMRMEGRNQIMMLAPKK
jgi:translation initiation factor IF-3